MFKSNVYKNQNFLKLLIGQSLSQFSDRLNQVAILWFIYEITGSESMVGLVATATALPYLLFGIIAGTLVDRLDKRKVMLIADIVRTILIITLPILGALKSIEDNHWFILIITFLISCVAQFFEPAKQSTIPIIVSSEELLSANVILSFWQQISRIFAPILAGIFMVSFSPYLLFLIAAVNYLVSAFLIFYMKYSTKREKDKREAITKHILETYKYVLDKRLILLLLVIYSGINMVFYGSSIVYPPIFSETILNMGSFGYGAMITAYTLGLVLGTFCVKWISFKLSITLTFSFLTILGGLAYLGIGLSNLLIVATLCFSLCGLFFNVISIMFITFLQKSVPVQKQGAVFGVVGMIGMGLTPLSTIIATGLLSFFKVSTLIVFAGASIVLIGIMSLFVSLSKHIYEKKEEGHSIEY